MRCKLDNGGLVELLCLDVDYVLMYFVYWTAADSVTVYISEGDGVPVISGHRRLQ